MTKFVPMLVRAVVTHFFFILTASTSYAQGFDPQSAHAALLAKAEGYFQEAGGTGGRGGSVYYVSNLDDSGPESLRRGAEQPGATIILFENGVDGRIDLSDAIIIASDKTIWGRHRDGTAADIFINPDSDSGAGFAIRDSARNVIISNFKGDASGPNDDAPDFVGVNNGGRIVWIDHITLIGDGTGDMDGAVDVTTGGREVTISWLRVEDWSNVHLLRFGAVVTLHHNLWRNSTGRHPKVDGVDQLSGDPGMAHAYNNWVDRWKSSGMESINGGELVVENNIFDAASDRDAIKSGSRWSGSGNVFTGGGTAPPQSSVFDPPYAYSLEPVGTSEQAQAFRDLLEEQAGWQSSFSDTPPTDSDGDGVPDNSDNCTVVANPDQLDTDDDGFGNICDGDFDNNCVVNPADIGFFRSVFLSANAEADLNGDGVVNPADLGIFRSLFLQPPGPSGVPNVCDEP